MLTNALRIHPLDHVAVALQDIPAGTAVALADGLSLTALDTIPFGHKVLLVDLPVGAHILKYGEVIGQARLPLKAGQWLHVEHFVAEEGL
jgi:hypothetical protein